MLLKDCLLICLTAVVFALAIVLPWPHPDRRVLEVRETVRSEYPNVSQVWGLWRANSSDLLPRLLNPGLIRYLRDTLEPKGDPPYRVLDVGCGSGLLALELASLPNYSVECLDPSLEALAQAEAGAREAGRTNIRFRFASVYFIPFEDHSFDAVILNGVLEFLPDLPHALLEVLRVLRSRGLLIFAGLDRSLLSWAGGVTWPQYLPRWMAKEPHDWRMLVQPEELIRAGQAVGLRRWEVKGFLPPADFLWTRALVGMGLRPEGNDTRPWGVGPIRPLSMYYLGSATKLYYPQQEAVPGYWSPGDICDVRHALVVSRCGIIGNGTIPNHYNVVVTGRTVKNIPLVSLFKPNDTLNLDRMRTYERGEVCEVTMDVNLTRWILAVVEANSTGSSDDYLYDIIVFGSRTPNFPGYRMRKLPQVPHTFEVDEWIVVRWQDEQADYWIRGRVVREILPKTIFWVAIEEFGKFSDRELRVHITRLWKVRSFEPGEWAWVMSRERNLSSRCRITASHTSGPDFPFYDIDVNGTEYEGVQANLLRKLSGHLRPGDAAEFLSPGEDDIWLNATVLATHSEEGSFDLEVIGLAGNVSIVEGVPFQVVREAAQKPEAPVNGYVERTEL